MDHFVNERQLEAIRLRKRGFTFDEISKDMGVSSQRAQSLYRKGLENLRIEHHLREHHREFIYVAEDFGWDPKTLITFYKILKRNDIEYAWKKLTDEELLTYPQIGVRYVEFMREARKYVLL